MHLVIFDFENLKTNRKDSPTPGNSTSKKVWKRVKSRVEGHV